MAFPWTYRLGTKGSSRQDTLVPANWVSKVYLSITFSGHINPNTAGPRYESEKHWTGAIGIEDEFFADAI